MRALNGAYLLGVLLAGTASTASCREVRNSLPSCLSLRGNLQQEEIVLSVHHVQDNGGLRRLHMADNDTTLGSADTLDTSVPDNTTDSGNDTEPGVITNPDSANTTEPVFGVKDGEDGPPRSERPANPPTLPSQAPDEPDETDTPDDGGEMPDTGDDPNTPAGPDSSSSPDEPDEPDLVVDDFTGDPTFPVDVADTQPEAGDVSLQVVGSCSTVLQAIKLDYPEFGELITNVIPDVTPQTTLNKFSDPEAAITVMMPPRDAVRGVQYSHSKGDMTSKDVRDVVLLHVLDEKLTLQDLVDLPEDTLVETLLVGSAIKPSLAGATSGSNAGEPGSGSVGLIDADLDVCTDTSTMHTLKQLLKPDDLTLPESAAPRSINQTDSDTVEDEPIQEETTDGGTREIPKEDEGLSTFAIIGIAGGGVLLVVALVIALCCCFNDSCSAMCGGSKKSKKSTGKDGFDTVSVTGSSHHGKPLYMQHPPPSGHYNPPSEHGSIGTGSSHPSHYSQAPYPGSLPHISSGDPGSSYGSPYGSTPGSHVSMHGMHVMSGSSPATDHSASYSQRLNVGSSAGGTGNGSLFGVVPSGPGSQGNTGGRMNSMGSTWESMPHNSTQQHMRSMPHQQSTASSMPGMGSHMYPYPTGPGGMTTIGITTSGQMEPPGENASPDDIKAWVEEQLDLLGDTAILGRFVSLGPAERRRGGQAVVQFASSRTDANQYALKFFLSPADFIAEKKIYTDSPLGELLPRHEGLYDNSDSILKDSRGHKLPPCIVMERGESLDEWSRRRKPDMWAAMPVLANIAKRLEAMHEAGYAHRDLKPANVMWLPRENQWTLIDFGCAAKLNEQAPLSFTLGYAAPETIQTWRNGQKQILSQEATDAWSLGVMVYELLTGKPAFDVFLLGRDSVVRQLLGEEPLPWERMSAATRKTLGAFKSPILQLLNRDPSKRPTMSEFYNNCNAIFSTSTTFTPGKVASMSSSSGGLMHVESGADSSAANTTEQTTERTDPGQLTEGATINGTTEAPPLYTQTINE